MELLFITLIIDTFRGWGGENLSDRVSSVISLKVDILTLRKIEVLVRQGYFKNRSEVIRAAIRAKLMKEKLGKVINN